MAADGTPIKQDIDNNLGNKGYRGIRIANIIPALKNLVDWVTTSINNNLTTWLRTSDNLPGGANGDAVYRTGKTDFRGGVIARAQTPNSNALATLGFNTLYPIQIQSLNGGPAFLEFHLPGNRIDQIGVDTDGQLKYRPWNTSAAYPLLFDTFTAAFALAATLANRKIVLVDVNKNDHQFYGFGVDSEGMRYQIESSVAKHIWYAGLSAASSAELMRLTGSGFLGVGNNNPQYRLDAGIGNPAGGVIAQFINIANGAQTGATGARIQVHQGGVAVWQFGQPAGVSAFCIWAYGAGAFPEVLRILENGNMGIGTSTPTSRLHLKGANGYSQLLLEQKYTPSGTGDANGTAGSLAWDDNYLYMKTAAGWKRAALNTF